MARRPWIKPTVRKLIADRAIRYPNASRLDLYTEIKRDLKEMGEVCPAEETAYKIISEARRTPPKFDESWSMAALMDNPLPPETLPAVLKVWRYAINAGEKFSVAQAEWAARLASILNQTPLLWFWSHAYAHEERLSIVTNEPMDSFRLDSALILSHWERTTLARTDYRDKPVKYRADRLLPLNEDGHIIEELLHGIRQLNPWAENDNYHERDYELSTLVRGLPALDTIGFTDEAKMVYLRWFTYLTKGPTWKDLTPEAALHLIITLRDIIAEVRLHRDARHSEQEQAQHSLFRRKAKGPANLFDHIESPSFYKAITPLLQKVGYQYASQEVNHERAHHKKRK